MKSTLTLIGILAICIFFNGCNDSRPIKECSTFEEMKDPTNDTLSDWTNVPIGLNTSFVSIDKRYPKSVAPDMSHKQSCKVTGWKGERISAQILLWTSENISQVECEFDAFESVNSKLPANIAKARFVRYVMTDEFGEGCGYRKPEDFAASLSADMLDNTECFNIPAKTVRPVWITIQIPTDAMTGVYKSNLKIYARDKKVQTFDLNLEILDALLPPAAEWKYHLDLWQHPAAIARIHQLELWSDAHFEAMRPYMEMLANAGQKVITTNLNKDPWNNQCYDAYADMILWTKNENGTWQYDYTVFDKWVRFMMDLGINKMINCYSILTWNNQLHYKDAKSGEMITVEPKAESKEYIELWTNFLADFRKHLEANKWLDITNIAMDERSPKEMEAALTLLSRVVPEFGVSLADNHKSYKKYPQIKDICVGLECVVDSTDIITRRKKGMITTYYVCCSHKFPNMFTFSAPAESVYAAWYAVAGDYDGFLHWSYNSWTENPQADSRFRTWPAGDTYMVYPEACSSIRFERLIEGVQDAEKIRILRERFTKENSAESLDKLKKLNGEIVKFKTYTPDTSWNEELNNAKELLNGLSM